jgi:hypothetical protein
MVPAKPSHPEHTHHSAQMTGSHTASSTLKTVRSLVSTLISQSREPQATNIESKSPPTETKGDAYTTATNNVAYTTLARVRRANSTEPTSSTSKLSCTGSNAADCTTKPAHEKTGGYNKTSAIYMIVAGVVVILLTMALGVLAICLFRKR